MRRFVQARLRNLFLGLICLAFCAPVAGAEVLRYDLPEARTVAMQAAVGGRPDVALTLTEHLLDADPNDGAAHLARGTAFLATRNYPAAYRGGRLAFRHAADDKARYQGARVAAMAAIGGQKNLVSQFWLRRAGDVAPTEADRKRVEHQFRVVKAQTPWRYRFGASVTPSSNVNGGADSPYNIIDGVPLVGILSNDARALSGWVAQSNLSLSYRLAQSGEAMTTANFLAYTKRVWLTDSARAFAPTFDTDTLNATTLSFIIDHNRKVGDNGAIIGGAIGLREAWAGGGHSYSALTTSISYSRPLNDNLHFSTRAGFEARGYATGGTGEVRNANGALTYTFANGNRLTGSVQYSETTTPNPVFDSRAYAGKITYALGQPVKSVMLSAGIGASVTDYPNYSLGFIPVPGGRNDEGLFADIDATFTQIEYAGFSPQVRLRRQHNSSNVSRYSTTEWAVSVGVQSNF